MSDIETTYEHKYTTRFVVDQTENFERLKEVDLNKYERIFLVWDEAVASIYEPVVTERLSVFNKEFFTFKAPALESTKSIAFYPKLVSFLEENNAGRYDVVIAVGGGIIIDLVSFTVSTYMRGLPLMIIASTLIGQTDASSAGKTCLNSYNAKNVLGTFYYPFVVYNNIPMMRTCKARITRQGLSEAFKYSLLTDGVLLDTIIRYQNGPYDSELMTMIVESTLKARIAVRKIDPLASNLGHTFGHALEKYYKYEILHGDAILIGTVMAMRYAVMKGLMEETAFEKIFGMMKEAHLNIFIGKDLDVHRLVEFMRKDKKSSASKLHLVLIRDVARPYRENTPFYEADYSEVEEFLQNFMKEYEYTREDYLEYLQGERL